MNPTPVWATETLNHGKEFNNSVHSVLQWLKKGGELLHGHETRPPVWATETPNHGKTKFSASVAKKGGGGPIMLGSCPLL